MNKCQHNLLIDQFCIYQRCQWKQPGGCQQCIKKYHSHYRQQKLITELQLLQYLKVFTHTESSHKPNCRNIQQAFYTYFNQLKNQLIQNIDLLCKTVINFIGAPYLMQNNLFNCYKRVKNKQYRRLNQKDVNKFCQVAKNTTTNNIIKQQNRLYKEQLIKFNKLINHFQSQAVSYQDLFLQANLIYKHQKASFNNLSSLLKQTLQVTDPSVSISQFHEKSLQKNTVDKHQKSQKSQFPLKSFNSQQYDKNVSKQNQITIPTFYSGLLPNKQKDSKILKNQTSLIGSQSKRQSSISKDSISYKLGIKDFKEIQKKQNMKQTINSLNHKRLNSLQKNLTVNNNKNTAYQIFVGKNLKAKNQFKFDENDEYFFPQPQKQKIYLVENPKKRNISGVSEIFNSQNASTFFTVEQQKRTESLFQKRQLSQKQAQINWKKQKLIQMMKSHQFSKKNSDPSKMENSATLNAKTYSKDTISKGTIVKVEQKQIKSNSVLVKPSVNRSEYFQKQPKIKKNASLFAGDKDFKNPQNKERKYSHAETPNGLFDNLQIDEINPINECLSQSYSIGSLEELKQFLPENNMNGLSKLPIQQKQEKPKVMACSRLIIVPTISKFPHDRESDSPLIKRKILLGKAIQQKNQSKNDQKLSPTKLEKKPSTKSQTSQKHEMTEQQQRSLSFLIKSIGQKPQDAILSLEAALKQSPNNLSAAQYLSYLYLQSQKPKQALTVCNKILDRFDIVSKQNEELLINLQNNKAAALNMLGRYSQAIVLLLKCLKIQQSDRMLKNLADAYYFSSSYQKAITYYEKTLRISPNYDQAYYNMAVCFYLQQNYQRTKHFLQKAIEIAPKNGQYIEFRRHVMERLTQKIR